MDISSVTHRMLQAGLLATVLTGCTTPSSRPEGIEVATSTDEGQTAFRITTPAATWFYQAEGAGFSSLLDPAGHDWISHHPTGGADGAYRGIPNAVFRRHQEGRGFFHPGNHGPGGSKTEIVSTFPDHVILRSTSVDEQWQTEWTVGAERVTFELLRWPEDDAGYWFLYEGTPGGVFNLGDECIRSDGTVTRLDEPWETTTADNPWTAFYSPDSGHALIIWIEGARDSPVAYRPMDDSMTIFGLGRRLKGLRGELHGPVRVHLAMIPATSTTDLTHRAAALVAATTPAAP